MEWGGVIEREIWKRIHVAIWAYAYEIEGIGIVSDYIYDTVCYSIDADMPTSYSTKDNSEIDKWWLENFKPDTGLWIWKHPELERIKEMYMEAKQKLEEEKKPMQTPDLKLIVGGKGPPTSTGNWLRDLEDGTVFLAQNKVDSRDFSLVLFRLEGKSGIHDKVVCLRSPNLPKEIYVDPGRFCMQYALFHIEGVMANKEENKEDEHNSVDIVPTEAKTPVE